MLYAFLSELHNFSNLTLMCYAATLAIFYLLVVLEAIDIYSKQSIMCMINGHIIHFILMANSFWLNIMSFDIYQTIAGNRGRMTNHKKLLYYCLCGWGTPLLFQSLIFLLNRIELISYDLRPTVGADKCVIMCTKKNLFMYHFLPTLLLSIANIVLFVISAKRISGAVQSDVDRKNRQRFSLCFSLFSIRSAILIPQLTRLLLDFPTWLYYALAAFDGIVGIIIFFLLVWKDRIRELLLQRNFKRKSAARGDHTAYTSDEPVQLSSLSNGDQTE
ncbi:G-protein coupled receptor Mth2-like [Anopheles albimanus]|uniref:G-protein coupled receptor Mth2-like n=1 Tax=Anopheles albimanus TaxID=7167 RepID=UPI00164218FD|nr:G-protein coupled receptor Mth2-like [Anopheles albimanus]